jgi:uncharacterized protein YjbJ (UPF0337 family)
MYVTAQTAKFGRPRIRASMGMVRAAERIGMNRDRIQGICRQFGGKLKEHWGTLTDDPLAAAAGRRDRLAGRIQEQRGISKQEAARQLEDFMSRNRNWRDLSRR